MELKRKRIKLDSEKDILTGMIVSSKFARKAYPVIKKNLKLFKSSHIQVVTSWCLSYFDEYDDVPSASIADIYKSKIDSINKEEDLNAIEDLLEDISEKFVEGGAEFDVPLKEKQTIDYCRKLSMEKLTAEINGLLLNSEYEKAEIRIAEYVRVASEECHGHDALDAKALREEIYSADNDTAVIRLPGAFGSLLGTLEKGGLYLLAANSKRGKSFVAIEIAKICVMAGLTVHYYTLEMNKKKLQERWDMNISKSWKYEKEESEDGEYVSNTKKQKRLKVPVFTDTNSIDFVEDTYDMISTEIGNRTESLFRRQYSGKLRIFDITTSGNSLNGIIANEDAEERYTGSNSTIVIIDSIYLCSDGFGEKEYQRYDNLHKRAKQDLGEKRGKVVITPYQFGRDALKNGGDETNLAGSYAVFSHASAALFLHANEQEMERGLLRVKASGRDNNYGGEVVCTRQLDLGRGFIESRWKKEIPDYDAILGVDVSTEEDMRELAEISMADRLQEV